MRGAPAPAPGRRLAVALALAALVWASRVPFASGHLWAYDSIRYARALEQGFYVTADPETQRPHPPGYIWYVTAAQAARSISGDSNSALVLVSVAASALSAALLFLVALRYVRPPVALLVAAAYAASPLVWLFSEVAYPYTVLGLVSLVLGALFTASRRPLGGSLVFGALGGFRQDLLILLAPLWLWSLRPLSVPRIAVGALALALGSLAWAVPSALLSGGPAAYALAVVEQSGKVTGTSAPSLGPGGLLYNTVFTLSALAWGLAAFAPVLAVAAVRRLAELLHAGRLGLGGPVAAPFLLWIAPALLFYSVVHIGEWGYVLSVLPPLFIVGGVVFDRAAGERPSAAWAAAGVAAVAIPAALFLFSDTRFSAAMLLRP